MKTINVRIEGLSPLLMNRYPLEPIKNFDKMGPEEQCRHRAHFVPDSDQLYVPGAALWKTLIVAAAFVKAEKGRGSMATLAAAGIQWPEEYLLLGQTTFTIDSRAVVNPNTKGRQVCHRPRIEAWGLSFTLHYDDDLMKEITLRAIVDNAGAKVGLLDFRPAKKGPFGKFYVTHWENGK